MKLSMGKVRIHNRFDIETTDIESGVTKKVAQAENIILDQMWTYVESGWARYTHIGTGTGVLDKARTTLFTPLFIAYATEEEVDESLYYSDGIISCRRSIVLSELQYVGSIFTEIGVGTSSVPCTHALLRDMNGNPVSIEKTNTEIMTIYSTVYAYIDAGIVDGSLGININTFFESTTITGNNRYSRMFRLLTGGGFNQLYYAFLSSGVPKGAVREFGFDFYLTDSSTRTWNAATKKYTTQAVRIPVGVNSVNPVRTIGWSVINSTPYQTMVSFNLLKNTAYAGSFMEGESIGVGDGVTKDFVTDYGFIKPGAIVYLDDIEEVGVTVDEDLPIVNDLSLIMNLVYASNAAILLNNSNRIPQARNDYCIYENPLYATIGVDDIYIGAGVLYCSDDMEAWTTVLDKKTTNGTFAIPTEYRNKRYWKYSHPSDAFYDSAYFRAAQSDDLVGVTNVHFDSAPAMGEVITIDYTTKELVKTANYVIDITIEFELGEYVEEY